MNFFSSAALLILLSSVSCSLEVANKSESELWKVPDVSLFPRLPIAVPWSEDEKCRQDSSVLVENLKNRTYWAMQMLDSSANAPFGILYGNTYQLGNLDECLLVKEPIRAQYCAVKFKATVHISDTGEGDAYALDPPPSATVWKKFQDSRQDPSKYPRDEIYYGLCVPRSCNRTELVSALNRYLRRLNAVYLETAGVTYRAEIPENHCQDSDVEEFSYGEIGFWAFTFVLLGLVSFSSGLDFLQGDDIEKETRLRRMLMKFSAKRNFLSLLERDGRGEREELKIIYGLRFYNILYIVSDHRVLISLLSMTLNSQSYEEALRGWQNLILPHGDLFVDTYFFFGGMLAITILHDVLTKRKINPVWVVVYRYVRQKRILMAFSLKRNVEKLFSPNGDGETPELTFFNGLKFVTIMYIVYDHRVAICLRSSSFNKQDIEGVFRSLHKYFLPHGDLLVDTFFFIGGFLVSYLVLKSAKKTISPYLMILGRFVRLAPLYLFLVWFQATAFPRFGSGPVWKSSLNEEIELCRKNWWANVLFIQNYVNPREMCMMHAWYLPCDLHFFIMTLLVVLAMKKNRKFGLVLLYSLTFIAFLLPGIITYLNELKPTVIFYHEFLMNPRIDPSFEYLYVKSHTRATVYLLGAITGYFLYKSRASKRTISFMTSVVGCVVGLALLFAPMAYGSMYYDPKREYNRIESSIFASLRRTSWGLAWVVFMLVNRFGTVPIVGRIFKMNIAVPLSKVTYGIYLVHFILQMADEAKVRIPKHFTVYDMFMKGTNDICFSLGYALVLYLVLELPLRLIFSELVLSTSVKKSPTKLEEVSAEQQANRNDMPKVLTIKL